MKKKSDKNGCTIHVRLPCWLKKKIKQHAEWEKQTLSAYVVELLRNFG